MTMPPPVPGQPPYPPGTGYPPPPAGPPRSRRTVLAAVIAALVVMLAAVGGTAWWVTRGGDGLADRPRVTDDRAGLSYAIPEGWKHKQNEDLIDAFTSSISKKQRHPGDASSVVLAGRTGPIPRSGLKDEAERAATSNAVFFFPDGDSTLEESRATEVSGRPAHTVVRKTADGEGGTGHLRLTVVAVDDRHSAFLLGVAQPDEAAGRQEVDAVLESAAVV